MTDHEPLKLLFLDIDGVLTDSSTGYYNFEPSKYAISDKCLDALCWLLMETGAKVVFSTNWRNHPDDYSFEFRGKLYRSLFPEVRRLIGDSYTYEIPNCPHMAHATKERDIAGFFYVMKDRLGDRYPSEFKYAILDDQVNQNLDLFGKHFFLCDAETGLTMNVARSVALFLNHTTKEK